jgi:hypothetical protein
MTPPCVLAAPCHTPPTPPRHALQIKTMEDKTGKPSTPTASARGPLRTVRRAMATAAEHVAAAAAADAASGGKRSSLQMVLQVCEL